MAATMTPHQCSCKIQVPSSTHPGSMHFVRAPPYWTLNTSFGLTPLLYPLLKWARTAAGAETFSLRHVSGEFRCLFALPACGSLWSLASVLPWAGCAPLGPLGVAVGRCGSSWLVGGFGPGDPDAKSFWRGVSILCCEGGAEKINIRFFAFKK